MAGRAVRNTDRTHAAARSRLHASSAPELSGEAALQPVHMCRVLSGWGGMRRRVGTVRTIASAAEAAMFPAFLPAPVTQIADARARAMASRLERVAVRSAIGLPDDREVTVQVRPPRVGATHKRDGVGV